MSDVRDVGTGIPLRSRRPLVVVAAAALAGYLVAGWALLVGGRR